VQQSGGLGHVSSTPFRSGTYTREGGVLQLMGQQDVSYDLCEEAGVLSVTATAGGIIFGPSGSIVLTRER
jgi:hypothetical protein